MYKVTIVDTETGEVHIDSECSCILISTCIDEDVKAMSLINTNGKNLLVTYAAMKKTMEHVRKKEPIIGILDEIGILDSAISSLDSITEQDSQENIVAKAIREARAKYGKKD